MNKFVLKLERKFGKYAVPHLTAVIIACYIIGYIIQMAAPRLLDLMYLDPFYILKGQVWRIVTWIVVPPSGAAAYNLFFAAIMLFFYFSIGTSLERSWGDFRYNLYIFGGLIISIIAAFLSYLLLYLITGRPYSIGGVFSTYYICMSILLAFAFTFPDVKILLWFVIPLKVKWLGIVYGLFMAYDVVTYLRNFFSTGNYIYIVYCIAIVASLANFFLFLLTRKGGGTGRSSFTRQYKQYNRYEKKEPASQGSFVAGTQNRQMPRHRCVICGRTDVSDPELDFRFCSKCRGGMEYCSDHLFTHEHVK